MPKTRPGHKKNSQRGKKLQIGGENIINDPLMPRGKTIFPLLKANLELMKQYVKTLNRAENCLGIHAMRFLDLMRRN